MKALAGTLILVIGAVALTAIVFKIFMRKARAEAQRSENERMMEEDAIHIARARLNYQRNRRREDGTDILKERFDVEVPADIRVERQP
ncbi:hypothetical protein [Thiobacillus denitrificans]|uniref:hypothetical protein n=1 Tax=Thiobacillus denitrificans TaxID=36861 RepID=UPI00037AEB22|nr:hypothetical protein [Thiobacillus denitrificans]